MSALHWQLPNDLPWVWLVDVPRAGSSVRSPCGRIAASWSIRIERGASEVRLLWHRRPMEVYDFPIRAALGDNECNASRIAKGLAIQYAG